MIVLLIGVGNDYRSDDGVGLAVARRLKALQLPNLQVIEETGEGASLMEAWQGYDSVILCDAVSSGAAPGTIHLFDARLQPVPSGLFRYSTHAFSVAAAIELARTLNRLPSRLIVYGIEGQHFEAGMGISAAVEKGAQEVVKLVLQEVGHA